MDILNQPTVSSNISSKQDVSLSQLLIGHNRQVVARIIETIALNQSSIETLLQRLPKDAALTPALQTALANLKQATNPEKLSPILAKLVSQHAGKMQPHWTLLDKPVKQGEQIIVRNTNNTLTYSLPQPVTKTPPRPSINISAQKNSIAPSAGSTSINTQPSNNQPKTAQKITSRHESHTQFQSALRSYLPKQDTNFRFVQSLLTTANKFSKPSLIERTAPFTHIKINTSKALSPEPRPTNEQLNAGKTLLVKTITTLQNWQNSLPPIANITPNNVSKSLLHSGVFMEQQLQIQLRMPAQSGDRVTPNTAPNSPAPQNYTALEDVKSVLLQLLATTQSATQIAQLSGKQLNPVIDALLKVFFSAIHSPETPAQQSKTILARLANIELGIAGALAKITTNQVASMQVQTNEANPSLLLITDLLFRWGNIPIPVNFQLFDLPQRKRDKEKQATRGWKILLKWEFPGYGHFASDIRLKDDKISSSLWVEDPDLRERCKEHIGKLRTRLESDGVVIDSLSCVDQDIESNTNNDNTDQLIDVRT